MGAGVGAVGLKGRMNADYGCATEEWATKSSPTFLHLSVNPSDWFPESQTAFIHSVSILPPQTGSRCPSNVTTKSPPGRGFRLRPACAGHIHSIFQTIQGATLKDDQPETTSNVKLLCLFAVLWEKTKNTLTYPFNLTSVTICLHDGDRQLLVKQTTFLLSNCLLFPWVLSPPPLWKFHSQCPKMNRNMLCIFDNSWYIWPQ